LPDAGKASPEGEKSILLPSFESFTFVAIGRKTNTPLQLGDEIPEIGVFHASIIGHRTTGAVAQSALQ
jgi:hypothetical protein